MNTYAHSSKTSACTTSARRILFTSIATLLAAHAGFAAEAVFSSGGFTSDATSGVNPAKTYTAIANVIGGDVVVNGATFFGSGAALSGTGWELTNVPNPFGGGGNKTTTFGASSIDTLFDGFQYGGNPGTLTLNGLIAGQTYVATLYNQAWVLGDNRTQNITSSEGASIVYNEDALEASALRYTFVATGEATTLNFVVNNPGNGSMHFYGLSNEQVFTSTTNTWSPTSGNQWNNVANWSGGVIPNAVGATASFSAQAGPTDVSISGTRTVGFVEVLGTGSYTFSGGALKLQADAGGTAVINTSAGGSHTIESTIQLSSDFAKFGAGTLTVGDILGGTKGVTVGGGTLRFTGVNDYTGATSVQAGATLDLNGTSQTLYSLSGDAGANLLLGGSPLTLENSTSTKFAGNIAGTGNITKQGPGQLTLSGANNYTGSISITGGTLRTDTANAGPASSVFIAGGATWDLGLVSHTVTGLTGNGTVNRTGVLTTGADGAALISTTKTYLQKLDFGDNAGAEVNGVTFDTAGTSGAGFTLTGAGVLFGGGDIGGYDQLVGDFYYGGNPGTLTFSDLTPGQAYNAVLYTKVGHWAGRPGNATFNEGSVTAPQLLGTDPGGVGYYAYEFIAQSNSFSITMAPSNPANTFHWFAATLEGTSTDVKTLTIGDTANYSFGGAINGGTKLVKQGSGIQELSGASNYGGGTEIAAGAIISHNVAGLGTGAVSIANGANYLAWFNGGSPVLRHNFTLNGLGGDAGDGLKGAIYADGGGGGFGEYVLTGSVTLAATSNIGTHNTNNLRVLGQITGPGGLTKGSGRIDENGTLILSNSANDYAGDTVIINGTVRLGGSEVIPHGAGKGNVIMTAGSTLDLAGNTETINNLSGAGAIIAAPGVVIGEPVFFSQDLETEINAAKTYTHALDFAEVNPLTINGVSFTGAGTTGPNWSLTGVNAQAGNGNTFASGDISTLLTNFFYNGNPATLTLTGLTPGTSYQMRLYQRQWGGDRTQLFAFNSGGSAGTLIYDEDISTTPSFLSFSYIADASGTATLNTTQIGGGTYHWFGLTNEELLLPLDAPLSVLNVGDATDSTYSGSITGALELNKVGTGELTLDGTLEFDTLTATEGQVTIAADAILDSLDIGAGATVVLASSPPAFAAVGVQAVPEPGSIALVLGGMFALLGRRRRSA